ncbi:glycerol-3-phosphate acyltransferase [Chloroflexota bacterium]
MNDTVSIIIALVCAYLLGSIPTAYIAGRLRKGVDIRQVGTRNMGAMNVIYAVGIVSGMLVLIADIGKGALAVLIARWLGVPFTTQLIAGGVAIIGHIFPVFLLFRGGKGGATAVGVLACLMPRALPFAVAIFIVAILVTRYPTVSYSLSLCCAPFVAWLIYHSGTLVLFSVIVLLMVLMRYIPRIMQMRSTGGSWRRVILRRDLKDRF